MEAHGTANRAKGNAEIETAKSKGYAEGVGNNIAGNMKSTFGSGVGNQQMHGEGETQRLKGNAQKATNQ